MYASRLFVPRIVAFCVLVLVAAGRPAAEATQPTNGGWQAAHSASATSSTPGAGAATWRMPNGQAASHPTRSAGEAHNPLRPKRPADEMPPEPASFAEPSKAAPLALAARATASRPAADNKPAAVQTAAVAASKPPAPSAAGRVSPAQRTTSAAQSPRGAAAPRSLQRPNTAIPPRSAGHRPAARLSQRMQALEPWEGDAEDLPLPSRPQAPMPDPFGPVAGGAFHDGHHYHGYDYMGPDGFCECCAPCGDGVACGDACGHDPCLHPADICNEDLFCLGPGDNESCHTIRVRVPRVQEAMVFAGVHGFKGPYDRDRDSGNFGFHEGFNISGKLPYNHVGYQYGYRATHSQLNGDQSTGISSSFLQQFGTAGLFRRAKDGLQFGAVWDFLRDERFSTHTFHQLRGEVSYLECGKHEIGIAAMIGLNSHVLEDPFFGHDVTFQASDQYLLFYRLHGQHGGEGRLYVGFNDASDGILGADMLLPVQDRWSVLAGFTYLIPDAPKGFDGASQEAWNVAISLVWHWDARARKCHQNPYRPLFNVADNGYLIVHGR